MAAQVPHPNLTFVTPEVLLYANAQFPEGFWARSISKISTGPF